MNLYKYHSKPKTLDHHDLAKENVPDIFWENCHNILSNPLFSLKEKEKVIAKSAKHSFYYAKFHLKGPFKLG